MSEPTGNSVHKEFELERMILFSDAVFAIAITLLIIEIKFPELPENYRVSLDLFNMFKPTLLQFIGFFVSFFIIGISWSRHLKMFRYLKAYDDGVIFRNLLSLLFIVAFPFAASGLIHFRPSFMFPIIIYIANIMLMALSNFWLAHYIFKHKPTLSMPGHEAEKRYIYMHSKGFAVALTTGFIIVLTTAIITGYKKEYITISLYPFIFIIVSMRRWLRKYKPQKTASFGE